MTTTSERLSKALAGRYTIDREVGQGGMAIVFLAHDLRHDRDVALKILRPELASDIGPDRFLHQQVAACGLQGRVDRREELGLVLKVSIGLASHSHS